jgi:hypothetical protein
VDAVLEAAVLAVVVVGAALVDSLELLVEELLELPQPARPASRTPVARSLSTGVLRKASLFIANLQLVSCRIV